MQVFRERAYRALNRIIPCDITQVLTLELSEICRPDSAIDEYQFGYMSAADVLAFSASPDSELKPEMAHLIESAEAQCFAALQGDRLAAYSWIATGKVAAEHNCGGAQFLGIGFQLPDSVAYLFKVLVLPEHRGKKLNGWMLTKLAADIASQNIKLLITTTDWTNYPFLSSAGKTGFQQRALAGEFIVGARHCYKLPDIGINELRLVAGGQPK